MKRKTEKLYWMRPVASDGKRPNLEDWKRLAFILKDNGLLDKKRDFSRLLVR